MNGTFNDFRKSGRIVEDPHVVVWLDEHPDHKFGDHRGDITPREVAEVLYMRVRGSTYGAVSRHVEEDEPVIVADIGGDRRRYDAVSGERL